MGWLPIVKTAGHRSTLILGVSIMYCRVFSPAGFYYKTFMWPKKFWMKYEEVIRHSAGLGKSPLAADPGHYDHQHVYCDVLVVGGGVTGVSAALAAANAAQRSYLLMSRRIGVERWPANPEPSTDKWR